MVMMTAKKPSLNASSLPLFICVLRVVVGHRVDGAWRSLTRMSGVPPPLPFPRA